MMVFEAYFPVLIAALWTLSCFTLGFLAGRYVADLLKKIADLQLKMLDNLFRWKYEDKIREGSRPSIIERTIHGEEEEGK